MVRKLRLRPLFAFAVFSPFAATLAYAQTGPAPSGQGLPADQQLPAGYSPPAAEPPPQPGSYAPAPAKPAPPTSPTVAPATSPSDPSQPTPSTGTPTTAAAVAAVPPTATPTAVPPEAPRSPFYVPPQVSPPPPEKVAEAKRFWEAGQKLMKDKLFREALASFLEAYRTAPRESTLNDIGFCYRSLQEFSTAYMAYEELLARFGPTMKPAKRVDTQRALEELAVLTGLVSVKTAEPGAKVAIDGRDAAVTPAASPIRVNLGQHTVTISKDGFDTVTKQITVSGHDTIEIADVLQKEITTGHVSVAAQVPAPSVHLYIDGKDSGELPWQGDIEPGSHSFEAHSATLGATAKRVDVHKREKYEVSLELKQLTATLTVTAPAPHAEIRVDKEVVGRGAWEGALPVGPHQLSVTLPGFLPYAQALVLHPDEHVTQTIPALVPEKTPAMPAKADGTEHASNTDDFWGGYRHIDFYGSFPVRPPSNDISNGVSGFTPPGATVTEKSAAGGGMAFNFGYMLGWVGLEGGFTLNFDRASFQVPFDGLGTDPATLRGYGTNSAGQTIGLARIETYDIYHIGAAAIGGVRFSTETRIARFTLAAHGGVGVKSGFWNMATNVNVSATSGPVAPYVVPTFMLDTGVELGGTPGTRFFIGAMMVVEHGAAAQTESSSAISAINALSQGQLPGGGGAQLTAPKVSIQHGTDVYIGPTLGFHFGS